MNQKQIKKAQKVVAQFFEKTTFEIDFDLSVKDEDVLSLAINCQEPRILIGDRGKTLFEIQYLLGRILRKRLAEQVYLDVDINQYKASKVKCLKEMAQGLADRVSLEGISKMFFPMSPYERRVVHLALAGRDDVKTESSGEEPYRRVVIKPC